MTFLSFGFSFEDLYNTSALEKLDKFFLSYLEDTSLTLTNRLNHARQSVLSKVEESALLLDLAPYVEDFIGLFFCIEKEIQSLQDQTFHLSPLYRCKRLFVQRQAAKAFSKEETRNFNGEQLEQDISVFLGEPYSDLAFARFVLKALEDKVNHQEFLGVATCYAAWALQQNRPSLLFRLPQKVSVESLFPVNRENNVLTSPHPIQRKGFDCTDPGITTAEALDQAHYCILCHPQGKDSCSKGYSESIKGCPLDQKISEMNTLRTQGYVLGALAMIMVDNPMVAATGHRICNDCEKACIFQKQEAVDVPKIETETLECILNLPWGVEIYSLLSRWNPLNLKFPLPKKTTEYAVLVAGMGPAGFTLAHYLLNEGHRVVGMERLSIEPLEKKLLNEPIQNWSALKKPLSKRKIEAFGGVMEYGITARWDKNYLKLIRILLERRSHFSLYDRMSLGKNLSLDQAFALGFDHLALCLGSGKPKTLSLPQIHPSTSALRAYAQDERKMEVCTHERKMEVCTHERKMEVCTHERKMETFSPPFVLSVGSERAEVEGSNGESEMFVGGVRLAAKFLIDLQLKGANQESALMNFQVRLPILVIGGGLTAVDTATEALAYYSFQVENFLRATEELGSLPPELSEEAPAIAQEFLTHARSLRQGDRRFLDKALTIVYRNSLQESPSYRLNHKELQQALAEGVTFRERATPLEIGVDTRGHIESLSIQTPEGMESLPCRTLLIAVGTQPPRILERENLHILEGTLLSYKGKPRASFFGDLHPVYEGNVVKAMASAKNGYPRLCKALVSLPPIAAPNLLEKLKNYRSQ